MPKESNSKSKNQSSSADKKKSVTVKKKVTLKKVAPASDVQKSTTNSNATAVKEKPVKLKVSDGFVYATGRRKESIAKVWIFKGTGVVKINHQEPIQYLSSPRLVSNFLMPVKALNLDQQYDIRVDVLGGGLNGQSDAAKLAVSRAILELNPDYRIQLKSLGLLTQDSREKERKKYGKRGARKSPQFRKR